MSIKSATGHLPQTDRTEAARRPLPEAPRAAAHGCGTLGKISAALEKIKAFAASAEPSRPGNLLHRLATFVRHHPRATAALCLGLGVVAGALLCIATGPFGVFIGAAAGMTGFLALECMVGKSPTCGHTRAAPQRTQENQSPYPRWTDDPVTSGAEYPQIVMLSPTSTAEPC